MFDDYGAAQQIGKLLLNLGHQRMALILARNAADEHFDNRQIAGWLDFCRQHDLFQHWEEPVYVICHPDLRRALAAYLARPALPTAIVLGSPALAGALVGLGDLSLNIPRDLSVAAWQYPTPNGAAAGGFPELTSVRPNLERMAECSLEMLDQMIRGESYPPPVRLPCTLVRTDSVAPPRSC